MTTRSRAFWSAVIAAHAFVAVAWLWLMPGGFPLWHTRFWANHVAPWLVLTWIFAVVWARWKQQKQLEESLCAGLLAAWVGALIIATSAFPQSAWRIAPLMLIAIAPMVIASRP